MQNYLYNSYVAYWTSSTPKKQLSRSRYTHLFKYLTSTINQYNHIKNNFVHLLKILCTLNIIMYSFSMEYPRLLSFDFPFFIL